MLDHPSERPVEDGSDARKRRIQTVVTALGAATTAGAGAADRVFIGAVSTTDTVLRMASAHDADAPNDMSASPKGIGGDPIDQIPEANLSLRELAQQPRAIEVRPRIDEEAPERTRATSPMRIVLDMIPEILPPGIDLRGDLVRGRF